MRRDTHPHQQPSTADLDAATDYLTTLWGFHREGFGCIAVMQEEGGTLVHHFVRLGPARRKRIQDALRTVMSDSAHIFYSLNAFSCRRATAQHVLPTRFAHVDADGLDPTDADLPPNIIVESSPGNFHYIYLLDRYVAPDEAQAVSRERTYALGGDRGGHNPAKLLRLPGSRNVKTKYR
jgi:hypothetical protein